MSYLKKIWPKRPGQNIPGQNVRCPNCSSTVHTVRDVLSIITYFMFSFILYNTSTPMSQATFLLIVVVCLFIMNKSRVINRFELLGDLFEKYVNKIIRHLEK